MDNHFLELTGEEDIVLKALDLFVEGAYTGTEIGRYLGKKYGENSSIQKKFALGMLSLI